MGTKTWIFALALSLTACTSQPKKSELVLDTSRLLQESELQGWKETSSPGPVVGDFDVVYDSQGSVAPVRSKSGCTVVTKGPESAIVCDKDSGSVIESGSRPSFDSI